MKSRVCSLVLGSTIVNLATAGMAAAGEANFSGFYAGGYAGYSLSLPDTTIEEAEIERTLRVLPIGANPDLGAPGSSLYARDGTFEGTSTTDTEGFFGGVQAGYTFQSGMFAFGIEGDYSFTELSGTQQAQLEANFDPPLAGNALTVFNALQAGTHEIVPAAISITSSIDDVASLRGRIGLVAGSLLIYGTGGVAWSKYRGSMTSPDGFGVPPPGNTREGGTVSWGDNLNGWVAGGGLEVKVTNNVLIRGEFLHYDFGTVGFDFADVNNIETFTGSQDVTLDQFRVGASYLFN